MSARLTPEARSAYGHFCDITTRWMDNDAYRHVNNVIYYSFFDTAVNQHLIASGLLDLEDSPAVGLVVENRCSYFSSLAFPDKVTVGVRVAHIGTSSIQYELGIFRNAENMESAHGHFVHVYVDRESNKPVPLPADVRAAATALQKN
jgi:acyl-CoA thioester hydrolase